MTTKAIEAGARAIDAHWSQGDCRKHPYEDTEREYQAHCRSTAQACIEAVIASGELVPASAVAEMRDETGWLIEKDDPPVYAVLTADADEHWASDAGAALRFSRREDAQAFVNYVGWTSPPVRVVEHMWPTQRSPEPAVSEVVVVPRVPTEAMVKAGQSAIPAGHGQAWIYAADAYSAMLNAATKDGERS